MFSVVSYADNLIANGSFEDGSYVAAPGGFQTVGVGNTSVTDWQVDGGNIDWIDTGFWNTTDGGRSIDMNGGTAGTISQVIATEPGNLYVVSFDQSGNPACGDKLKKLQVTVGGSVHNFDFDVTGLVWPTDRNVLPYESRSFLHVATSAATNVEFSSQTTFACGSIIDNVSVTDPVATTCPCDGFKNHGQFQSCTARTVEDYVQSGVLTNAEGSSIISAAARSSCSKKAKKSK